ncbi:MAG: hypothetical protein ACPLY9_01520 [Nitrososphaerales archaeon]
MDEDEERKREHQPFSMHDWIKDFERSMLEQKAKQLRSEYEALKAVHDYSEKLEALKAHIEAEKQGETEVESVNEDSESCFEVEVDDGAIETAETLSEAKVASESSEVGSSGSGGGGE